VVVDLCCICGLMDFKLFVVLMQTYVMPMQTYVMVMVIFELPVMI
jgi:hypothetical protein